MAAPAQRPREVLIVDDSMPTARALAELLLRQGLEVAAFTTATEALKYIEVGHPAAAVVDIHLPDMSGLAISQYIRQRFGDDLPIILISGDTSMGNINSLSIAGATYFYSKPIRASQLLDRIRELLAAAT
jgi:CheY-like chemotaxis protein